MLFRDGSGGGRYQGRLDRDTATLGRRAIAGRFNRIEDRRIDQEDLSNKMGIEQGETPAPVNDREESGEAL